MKKYKQAVIYVVSLILIVLFATIGYNILSKNKTESQPDTPPPLAEKTIPAVDFSVLDSSGNSVNLKNYFGKPIIVNFWATWCGPCKSELPAFNSIYSKYKDKVEILMVNLTDGSRDTVDSVKEFVKENNFSFPVFYDTEYNASNTYGVYSIPVTLFINKEGNIIAMYNSPLSEETLEKYVNYMLEN